jgi:hypothetical protein
MGFGEKLLSTVWESKKDPAVVPPVATAAQATTATPVVPKPSVTPVAVYGAVNEEMAKEITSAVDSANLPGYDYLELKQALEAMKAIPMSEEHKIAAAFATASATSLSSGQAVTRETLLSSVDHYVGIVDTTEKNFLDMASQKEAKEVGGRDTKIAEIDAEIMEASAQIQKLTQQITVRQEDKTKLMTEKVEQQQKIENVRNSYRATADHVRKMLLTDKARIEAALPVSTITQAKA